MSFDHCCRFVDNEAYTLVATIIRVTHDILYTGYQILLYVLFKPGVV